MLLLLLPFCWNKTVSIVGYNIGPMLLRDALFGVVVAVVTFLPFDVVNVVVVADIAAKQP